jgi:hypothetical protein
MREKERVWVSKRVRERVREKKKKTEKERDTLNPLSGESEG